MRALYAWVGRVCFVIGGWIDWDGRRGLGGVDRAGQIEERALVKGRIG